MSPSSLRLELVEEDLAVCRLDPGVEPPAPTGPFHSVTRTGDELSVVCGLDDVPAGAEVEEPFAALRVSGKLPFSLTGVLSGLTSPLAAAGVSVFAVSTYDTDYVLVPKDMLGPAAEALRGAGHEVRI